MVFFASILGAALFAGVATAAPRPDSAIGDEVAVSAPNGVIISDTTEASSASAYAASSSAYYPATATAAYTSAAYSSVATYAAYSSAAYDSASVAYDTASELATSTASAYGSSMTWGSGSNSWGGSGYDSCVNQCIAEFGAPPTTWTPPPSTTTYSGTGVVHTVVVAPTQGVLRFVPPLINASVGDTVHFEWHANNHTVTKSSQLEMCNKTSDAPFASGEQNMPFTFDQVVNDTNPIFYYCGTPTHCQKGMFGVINPPMAYGSNVTVDSMMPSMLSNSSTLSAMMSYAASLNGSDMAMAWGGNVNMSAFPAWSHSYVAENVLYARALFAKNPDTMKADGTVDMSAGGNPITFPQDLASVMAANNAAASSSSSSAAPSSTGASSASDSASASGTGSSAAASPTQTTNSAGHLAASGALLSVAAIAASLLAL